MTVIDPDARFDAVVRINRFKAVPLRYEPR
jgi:hypothetical protein